MKTDPTNKYEQYMKRRRRIFREAFRNPEVLEELKRHFQTDLPCFQGKAGSYDPLDAMRRDAYREVVLFIEAVMGNHYEPEEEITGFFLKRLRRMEAVAEEVPPPLPLPDVPAWLILHRSRLRRMMSSRTLLPHRIRVLRREIRLPRGITC